MDKENKVQTFEEIGLINPYAVKKSLKNCIKEVASWDFYNNVYKEELLGDLISRVREGESKVPPPKCMFYPEQNLLRIMVKAVL